MKRLFLLSVLWFPYVAIFPDDDFVRGDATGDSNVDVSDSVHILGFLLLAGSSEPWHFDAADVNDDGFITLEDPIWLVRHTFSLGLVGPIPAPYPLAGQDPTADTISQGSALPPPEPPPDPDFLLSLERETAAAVPEDEVSFRLQIRYRPLYAGAASQAYAAVEYDPAALEFKEVVGLVGESWDCSAIPSGEGAVAVVIHHGEVPVDPPEIPPGPVARLTFVARADIERPEADLVYTVGEGNRHFYTGVGYYGPDESVPVAPQPTILHFAIATRVPESTFLRGDANGDLTVDIGDATAIQSYLAGNQPPIAHYDALDVGDDGFLTFEDSIWLLRFLVGIGRPPLPPHPEPGLDPTPDTIDAMSVFPPPEPPPDGRYKVWLHWVTSPEIVAGDTVRLRLKVIYDGDPDPPPTQAHGAIRFTASGLRLETVEPLLGEGWEALAVELKDETVDPPAPTGQLGVVLLCRECVGGTPRPIPSGEDAVEITFTAIPSMLPVVPQVELVYTVGRGNLHFYTGVGIFSASPEAPVEPPLDPLFPLFRVSFRETGSRFIRGDANGFGESEISVDISDPVYILSYLYLGVSPEPRCLDSLDADDTGEIELTDAVYLLDYLFLGGPKPPLPFGETPADCDVDPTSYDDLGCEFYGPSYAKQGSSSDRTLVAR